MVVKTELELKLLTTAQHSEVLIFGLLFFSAKLLFKNTFIENWPRGLLDFKWLVECDDSLCFLFSLFLTFFDNKLLKEHSDYA